MSENTPQSPYGPDAGGAGQPPVSGGSGQPPAYGGTGQPPSYGGPTEGYGTQSSGPFGVGEALSFAWNRFKGNWLFWVLFVLLLIVVFGIFNASSFTEYRDQMEKAANPQTSGMGMGMGIGTGTNFGSSSLGIIGSLILSVLTALGINAALREVSGQKATWGTLFKVNSYGMILLTALLLLVANFIGLLLCGIGAVALAIFAPFTYHNVVDRGANAWEALTSSFRQVGKNFGPVFLLELALLGLNIVGALLCGLGLFLTLPLSMVAVAYAYRRVTGGLVATGATAV